MCPLTPTLSPKGRGSPLCSWRRLAFMAAAMTKHAIRRSRSRLVVLIPYLWLIAFFLVPFVIVAKISLSQTAMALPPYTPVLDLSAGWAGLKDFVAHLTLDAYVLLGSDEIYLRSYLKSLEVAGISTALLVLIGYPV